MEYSKQLTDRELLDKAAKAAGIGPLDFDYAKREGHGLYLGPRLPMPQGVVMGAMWTHWNPLKNDGDALRLAVQLHISIYADDHGLVAGVTKAQRQAETDDPETHIGYCEGREPDSYAATRRAIVRAAAKMADA